MSTLTDLAFALNSAISGTGNRETHQGSKGHRIVPQALKLTRRRSVRLHSGLHHHRSFVATDGSRATRQPRSPASKLSHEPCALVARAFGAVALVLRRRCTAMHGPSSLRSRVAPRCTFTLPLLLLDANELPLTYRRLRRHSPPQNSSG